MIHTFTLNPAVDYYIKIGSDLMIDEVNRGSDALFKAGGKGLNVSKILSVLGIRSKAVALLGGFTGDFIRSEIGKDGNIELTEVRIEGNNRINVKAHHDDGALCINGEGPVITEKEKEKLFRVIDGLNEGDLALISGSMPKGMDEDDLIEMADRIHERNAKLVIDMEKVSLELLKRCRPDLIKPNLYELRLLMKDDSIDKKNAGSVLEHLRKEGIGAILLSIGRDGALLADEEGLLRLIQPDTLLVNKVGAGDAMLGAFLGKLDETGDRELALKYAGAAGNAVASKLEDVTLADIMDQLALMKTERVNI